MKIQDIIIYKIFDSRGNATIEVGLATERGEFRASVPSGKSRGSHEAAVIDYEAVVGVVKKLIRKKIIGKNYASLQELDRALIVLDGTKNKTKLGGNVILGISIAGARAFAAEQEKAVWEYINEVYFSGETFWDKPVILSNVINGGVHASNNLVIQEYMVVAAPGKTYGDTIGQLIGMYQTLGDLLKKTYQLSQLAIGDEGGYSLNFPNSFEPINVLASLIRSKKKNTQFSIGLDVAASSFYKKGKYTVDGKSLSRTELIAVYKEYVRKSKLLTSIEDPFEEKDFEGFRILQSELKPVMVIGDDLTTTNADVIERCGREGAIQGVIIKPNQIGSVMEACEAIKHARNHDIKSIISHRSGETEDVFIIQLAKASGAWGVKIGAPAKERMLKFNELIRLYD